MADLNFHLPDFYKPTGPYAVLPMRFERWQDGRVFLSNEIGEAIVLAAETFDAYIKRTLTPQDPAYFDLQSKHFLKDDTNPGYLDLMASKYLTKLSFLEGFTKLHIFVTTLRCNQSCPYCQVSRQGEAAERGKFDMTPEVLEKSIRLMLASPAKHVTMEFQGGEPLVRFDIVKAAVARTRELNEKVNKKIDFVLCTNLSLLTDQHLDWIKANDVLVSTSLDGPRELHDRNRPMGGRGSHAVVERNIRRAQEALGKQAVSALMTTTRESLKYPTEIVDEYLRLDMGSVFIRELNPFGFAVKSAGALGYSSEAFVDFYKRVLTYILEVNKRGRTFSEAFASLVLTKALTPWPIGFVDLQSPAGAGIGVCLYNYDGEVYVSDEARMLAEAGDPELRLGNVLENSYDELFFGEAMQAIAAASCNEALAGCSDCAYRTYCGADPVRNYRTHGDLFGNRAAANSFCKRNKAVIRFLMQLTEDADDEIQQILWAWVTHQDVNALKLSA